MAETPLIELRHFIQAIRDAGYKGTHSAIAELVDNSFEANARTVSISLVSDSSSLVTSLVVADDGCGMSPSTLKTALQFGGSSRFGSRGGTGRYGMGLPNSSVSQSRRVEVFTWTSRTSSYWSYLDIDEIVSGTISKIPEPRKTAPQTKPININHGTVVAWSKCDRISQKSIESLKLLLHKELGRIFRKHLGKGKSLLINGEKVLSADPLCIEKGNNLVGALPYGNTLEFPIKVPSVVGGNETSRVRVTFVELPVEQWAIFSNRQKNDAGISKNPGVSILRGGREIERGWYFMGDKRKENYDDWWRCEVAFEPELDELFGVTHTKQGINPTQVIQSILSPDMESIAHKLNARVRSKFIKLKSSKILPSERHASECDAFFEPPVCKKETSAKAGDDSYPPLTFGGLRYRLNVHRGDNGLFFESIHKGGEVDLTLNEYHPFFQRFYGPLNRNKSCDSWLVKKHLELLLFAAARAEHQMLSQKKKSDIPRFKDLWSDVLASFLA